VVIPVFNGAAFLAAALDSVAAQTYPHWEVVVVDDGSTDTSGALADAAAARDPRVRVLHQPNAGHSAARNRGLVGCRGEYLQFLDADDRLRPEKLQAQVGYLEQHLHVDIVTGEALYLAQAGRETPRPLAPPAPNLEVDMLLRNALCIDSPLVRRRVLARVGGFRACGPAGQRLYGCEDWDLWLRAVLDGCTLAHVPGVVVENVWHAANAQHDRARMLEAALAVLQANASAVHWRNRPWWALSLLEKRLALLVARRIRAGFAERMLRGVWRHAAEMRDACLR